MSSLCLGLPSPRPDPSGHSSGLDLSVLQYVPQPVSSRTEGKVTRGVSRGTAGGVLREERRPTRDYPRALTSPWGPEEEGGSVDPETRDTHHLRRARETLRGPTVAGGSWDLSRGATR